MYNNISNNEGNHIDIFVCMSLYNLSHNEGNSGGISKSSVYILFKISQTLEGSIHTHSDISALANAYAFRLMQNLIG